MKVLVTGASGFIGRHVVTTAAEQGHDVTGLVRNLNELPQIKGVKWLLGSIEDTEPVTNGSFDALIHLAAHGVNPMHATWETCFKINVTDSLNFWLAAEQSGCKHFVICGSCFEYGTSGEHFDFIPVSAPLKPTGPYHASKAASSIAAAGFCVDKGVKVYIPRPFHVYGEGEAAHRFWPSLRTAALAGEDFSMSSGEQIRDFTPVEMVAAKLVDALTRSDLEPGKPIFENIGTGKPKKLAEFGKEQWQSFGGKGRLQIGTIPLRANEVMRYVPEIPAKERLRNRSGQSA